jgi:hypothetical protein
MGADLREPWAFRLLKIEVAAGEAYRASHQDEVD